MGNMMFDFYRRAAAAATWKGRADLAHAALAAANRELTEDEFAVGTVRRPVRGPLHAVGGASVGQSRPANPRQPPPPQYPPERPQGPPYPCPPGYPVDQWSYDHGCPLDQCSMAGGGVTMGCGPSPAWCNYNVIGANTLNTDGIASGALGDTVFTAGDAKSFTPKYVYFEAQVFDTPLSVNIAILPPGRADVPVLLEDCLIGRVSQLRRGGAPDVGIPQGAFSLDNGPTPVDWGSFTSTQEHNLRMLFRCITSGALAPIHVFSCLWGDI